jgi:ribonuclease HII
MSQLPLFDEPSRDAPIGAIDLWLNTRTAECLMGVDEAGRGPLAGPVVAAAVVLPMGPPQSELSQLNDSKVLSETTRSRLARVIAEHALAVGVGLGSPTEIDSINILESTRQAMHRAITMACGRLDGTVGVLMVDGHLPLPNYTGLQYAFVKGDGRSWAIAAASIVAKVVRDSLMRVYERAYPGYGFAQHKGYGTVAHRLAMAKLGLSPIHRNSFKWKRPHEHQT